MNSTLKYKRILLKLSGEVFAGEKQYGIEPAVLASIAGQIKGIWQRKVQVASVIGGGNIFRGLAASQQGMDRASADYMGMLATVINALALQDALERIGVSTRTQTAIEMRQIAEPFIRRRAIRHLEKGRVVLFAAGTGNPYFTTDTTAALRAAEIGAEAILKATKVDGVYDQDPLRYPQASKYEELTYLEMLNKELKIMDSTAISLAMDNKIPVIIFDLTKAGNMEKIILGEKIGTYVGGGKNG